MKDNKNKDTLVYRLSAILVKLNNGEKLEPHALAQEFGVNLRTIQRDLNQRFAYLPLVRMGTVYTLDPVYLGKLSTKDIDRFACLAGVRGLFPSLSNEFLGELFDARMQSAILVKGHQYESLSGKEKSFREMEDAIIKKQHVAFDYTKDKDTKRYTLIAPFKLINNKGIWYLAGLDGEKLKTFAFTKISNLAKLDSTFIQNSEMGKLLAQEEGVWISQDTQEIVLKIAPDVAGFFKRRKLIANQVIEKELENGGLIVSAKVGHMNQVLPIVRYWIPHIRIISPEGLQDVIDDALRNYLGK